MIGLRHVALRVRDIARSRAFYESVLGMRFVGFRSDGVAMDLADGTVNLTLLPYDGSERTALPEGTEFIHLGFLVDDLATTYKRIQEFGSPVVRDDVKLRLEHNPGAAPAGSLKVLDPDGNVIDVSERSNEWRMG